jgi:hypothetical protein
LLKQLITLEVVRWKSLSEVYRPAMESEPDIFGGEWGKKSLEDLKQRIVEHVSRALLRSAHQWV